MKYVIFLGLAVSANLIVFGARAADSKSCEARGSYVSKDSCRSELQCGTVDFPFCTIKEGVREGGTVKVATSEKAYEENIDLREGIEVEGGFNSAFNAASEKGPTIVRGEISFPGNTKAILRRLNIEQIDVVTSGKDPIAQRQAVLISGGAFARLEQVNINRAQIKTEAVAKKSFAIAVSRGNGGTLSIVGGSFYALPGSELSAAVFSEATLFSVRIDRSILVAGDARRSQAVAFHGKGALDVSLSQLRPSHGIYTAGIYAVAPDSGGLRVRVFHSKIWGGPEQFALRPNGIVPSRSGISLNNASLEIQRSEVVGNVAGDAHHARGIEMISGPAVDLVAENNEKILGGPSGAPINLNFESDGILLSGNINAQIRDNRLIQGCQGTCADNVAGIHLQNTQATPIWTIEKNDLIAGAGGRSAFPHVGIKALGLWKPGGKPAHLVVSENRLIVGNPEDKNSGLNSAIGIWTIAVDSKIVGNHLESGPSLDSASIDIEPSAAIKVTHGYQEAYTTALIKNNTIVGDRGNTSADITYARVRFEENFLYQGSVGIISHSDSDSVYANNIVIASFACAVGCGSYTARSRSCGSESRFTFAHNLCFATHARGWGLMRGNRSENSRIANNIVMGAMPVLTEEFLGSKAAPLDHNALIPLRPSGCLYYQFGSFQCESNPSGVSNTNLSAEPSFKGPLSAPWLAEKFAPLPVCPLAGQGERLEEVSRDYRGKDRAPRPAIGPYECT